MGNIKYIVYAIAAVAVPLWLALKKFNPSGGDKDLCHTTIINNPIDSNSAKIIAAAIERAGAQSSNLKVEVAGLGQLASRNERISRNENADSILHSILINQIAGLEQEIESFKKNIRIDKNNSNSNSSTPHTVPDLGGYVNYKDSGASKKKILVYFPDRGLFGKSRKKPVILTFREIDSVIIVDPGKFDFMN